MIEWGLLCTRIAKILAKISPKLVKRNTNSWTSKIKDLNVETTIGSFYGKEVLLSKSWMSYYLESDSYIRD